MAANSISNGDALSTVRTKMNAQFAAGIPFSVVAHITAAAAGTPVHAYAAALVGAAQAIHIDTVLVNVNGATAWTDATGTVLKIQDTSAVVGLTVPKAVLLGNAVVSLYGATNTVGNAILQNTGFTVAAGLDVVADHNFAAGSDIYVKITGMIY